VPAGVEACRRSSASGSYLFLLNHSEHEAEVELPPTAELVLGETPCHRSEWPSSGSGNARYVGRTRVTMVKRVVPS
jgi:glycosyl hydrolase family 42 (putative beta-galactosidase)